MRSEVDKRLSEGRVRQCYYGSNDNYGLTGAFELAGPCGERLKIIANTADPTSEGWEHVSVSTRRRCPNWQEMCWVKSLFWGAEETVIQFHLPESDYVNNHAYCLHLWRDTRYEQRRPPSILVGIKAAGELA